MGAKLLENAALIYANHGFTLLQEGAADLALIALYEELLRPGQPKFRSSPVAVALVAYDAASADFQKTIDTGLAARDLIGEKTRSGNRWF